MNSVLRSSRHIRLVVFAAAGAALAATLALLSLGTVWTEYDYKVLDRFYRKIVQLGHGPKQSPQVVFVTITDRTYDFFAKNILDRMDLARVNDALSQVGVEAVAYDVIFARPADPKQTSVSQNPSGSWGASTFPSASTTRSRPARSGGRRGRPMRGFARTIFASPSRGGRPGLTLRTRALMQLDAFQEAAFNSGHISAYSDPDGVYRHLIMLLKVEEAYFPTLALSMFLDHMRIPFEKIIVHWGEEHHHPRDQRKLSGKGRDHPHR